MKEGRHKRKHTVLFYFYEMPKIHKYTESGIMVTLHKSCFYSIVELVRVGARENREEDVKTASLYNSFEEYCCKK